MRLIKKITLLFTVLIIFISCTRSAKTVLHAAQNIKGKAVYGDSIKEGNVFDLGGMQTVMQRTDKMDMRLTGRVEDVCKKKGCWMTMRLADGEEMRITFKGYSFFVPQTLKGKIVMLNGVAYKDTISIERERHYAEDAGKSTAEIANLPVRHNKLAFEANGVVVL